MPTNDRFRTEDALAKEFEDASTHDLEQDALHDDHPIEHPDELDHLETTLEYTPGGTLEQEVHTQLSDQARRAYQSRQQPNYQSDSEYERQVDQQFERAVNQEEAERIAELAAEERELGHDSLSTEFQHAEDHAHEDEPLEAWHDDPEMAAEYAEWVQSQESERTEAEFEQMLDRIDGKDEDQSPAFLREEEGESFPRLYDEPDRDEDSDVSYWQREAEESQLRDDWGEVSGPEISHDDAWDGPAHDAGGGHEH